LSRSAPQFGTSTHRSRGMLNTPTSPAALSMATSMMESVCIIHGPGRTSAPRTRMFCVCFSRSGADASKVGVAVAVPVTSTVGVRVTVAVGVLVAVAVDVAVGGTGVGDGSSVAVRVGSEVAVGWAVAATATTAGVAAGCGPRGPQPVSRISASRISTGRFRWAWVISPALPALSSAPGIRVEVGPGQAPGTLMVDVHPYGSAARPYWMSVSAWYRWRATGPASPS